MGALNVRDAVEVVLERAPPGSVGAAGFLGALRGAVEVVAVRPILGA
jgi:hypothetical protein